MDSYDLIEVIGEGTYGVVYKCRDRRTNRIVAVKQFKDFHSNDYIRCTMLRELRVEQLLKGEPNVTQLLEAFKQKNRLYLVMEYIPRNLLDVLEEHRSGLSEDSLIVLLYTLLLGVRSCHRNGIIHRDIKPENILVRDDGTASLCDFGFCRPVLQQPSSTSQDLAPAQGRCSDSLKASDHSGLASASSSTTHASAFASPTAASTVASAFLNELVLAGHRGVMTDYVATRWYRSPEMLLGMPSYSYAVDMWAIGAIMAETIDGEPLLPGKTELEQLALIQTRVDEFPAAYEAAVRKRNGGILHLRTTNPLAKPQTRARVSLSSGDGECSENGNVALDANGGNTVSSYLSIRYGGRIKRAGMQLLAQLLCVDADGRPTVEEALAHPYFDSIRHDARFNPRRASETEQKSEAAGDEDSAMERESATGALSRPATSSTANAPAAAGPLPSLSLTARPAMAPLSSTNNKHNSALKASIEGSGGDNGRLFKRAERGRNAGRPPRATDLVAHAANGVDNVVIGSPIEDSLPNSSFSLVLHSLTNSPKVASLPQLSVAPFPLLDGKGGASPSMAAEGIREGGESRGNKSDIVGDSPPPRPATQEPASSESNLPQRQHTARERTDGSTATTAAAPSGATDNTDTFAKGGSGHVSTLLFKTKKGRATAEAVLVHHRHSKSEEGTYSDGYRGSPFSSRFTHLTTAASTAGAGSSALAPLRRRLSGGDTEGGRTQPYTHKGSTSLHISICPNESPTAKGAEKRKKNRAATPHDGTLFGQPRASRDEEAEEACMCMSAPRTGGGRQAAAEGSTYTRTNTYTIRSAQQNRQEKSSRETQKNTMLAPPPDRHTPHRPSTPQNVSGVSSSALTPPADEHQVNAAAKRVAVSPAARRSSTKRQRGGSPPRHKASLHSSQAALAATQVPARGQPGKPTSHKSTVHCLSSPYGSVGISASSKKSIKPASAVGARSSFASPKLPRVVKPLQPRERMTLLKEIESLGCPVEAPSAVEVMIPLHSSSSAKGGDPESQEDVVEIAEEGHEKGDSNTGISTSASVPVVKDLCGDVRASQLTAGGGDLFVEGLGSNSVSLSPLLSEASGSWDSTAARPLPLAAFPANEGGGSPATAAVSLLDTNASATATSVQSRPPRMDFGYPTTTAAHTSSNSNRAQPSLYFRSTRNAPAPLKLAAIYMNQGAGPLQLSAGGLGGANASTEGTPSSSVQHAGGLGLTAAAATLPSQTSSTALSLSFGCRRSPTLLRHAQSRVSASQSSPFSPPMDPPHGINAGEGVTSLLHPTSVGIGPNSNSSRSPREEYQRFPMESFSLPVQRNSAGYLSEKPPGPQPAEGNNSPTCAHVADPPHQRRLSATQVSLSASGDFSHGGSLR